MLCKTNTISGQVSCNSFVRESVGSFSKILILIPPPFAPSMARKGDPPTSAFQHSYKLQFERLFTVIARTYLMWFIFANLHNCICVILIHKSLFYCFSAGQPFTAQSEETRVWQKKSGHWLCVHFHRSSQAS